MNHPAPLYEVAEAVEAVDWERAASQLLRAIRGDRSQVAFSRRLGYRSNPVADWEAGRRQPTAAEMLRACDRAGIDVPAAFASFTPGSFQLLGQGDDQGVADWLSAQRGALTLQDVADRCDRSRYAVGRWLSGATRPRVPDFLRLVQALTGRCVDLIGGLVDLKQVAAVRGVQERLSAVRRIAAEAPWTLAVRQLLATTSYRRLPTHRPGWIADRLGLDMAEEARCLSLLEEAEVVAWDGRRYALTGREPVQHPDADVREKLFRHWNDVAVRRREAPGGRDWSEGLVFACSREDLAHVREVLQQALSEVGAVQAGSEPQKVGYVQLSLVELTDPPRA